MKSRTIIIALGFDLVLFQIALVVADSWADPSGNNHDFVIGIVQTG